MAVTQRRLVLSVLVVLLVGSAFAAAFSPHFPSASSLRTTSGVHGLSLHAHPANEGGRSAGFRVPSFNGSGNGSGGNGTGTYNPSCQMNYTSTVVSGVPVGCWNDVGSQSTSTPTGRQATVMVYDPPIHAVLLFGGVDAAGNALGDTWTWSNGTWTDLTASLTTAPAARWQEGMAWDAKDGYVVLFGGRDNGPTWYNDTWKFNGTAWTKLTPTSAPQVRNAGPMIYDIQDGYVLLWGGNSNFGAYHYNDTWSFSNGNWTNMTGTVKNSPSVAQGIGFGAYDAYDHEAVFYGGSVPGACSGYGNTWTYSNGTFTNQTANQTTAPSAVIGSRAMTYDPQELGVLFSGGYDVNCGLVNDTWVWHANHWIDLTSYITFGPHPRWDGDLAYDPYDHSALLFGGNSQWIGGSNYFTTDTWNYTIPSTVLLAATPGIGIAPMKVNFTATLLNVPIGTLRYNWSFGDGSPNATTQNATHLFASAGTFNASGLVTLNGSVYVHQRFTLHVYNPLSTAAISSASTGDAPLKVVFNSTIHGGVPSLRYLWSFGDSTNSTAVNSSHRYSSAGTFHWNFTVWDSDREVKTVFGNLTVYSSLSMSTHVSTPRGITPSRVWLNATPSGGHGPYTVNWQFGDGSPDAAAWNASHVYRSVGTFTANVSLSDSQGRFANQSVTVQAASPLAPTAIATPANGISPLVVQFTAGSNGGYPPYTFSWTFGAVSGSGAGPQTSFVYPNPGTYQVNLTVNDSLGYSSQTHLSVQVVAPLATVLTETATLGPAPLRVNLTETPSGGVLPLRYDWNFGDGTTSSGLALVSHTFETPGSFTVVSKVTDNASHSVSHSVMVEAYRPLTVQLSSNVSSTPLGGSFLFTAQATGGTGSWSFVWSGLPTGCPMENRTALTCQPTAAGTYNVNVNVSDPRHDHVSAAIVVIVTPAPPPPSGSTNGGIFGLSTLDLSLIIALAAVLAIAGLLLSRRGRPGAGLSAEPSSTRPETTDEVPTRFEGDSDPPP